MSLFGKKEKQGEPIVEQENNPQLDMIVSTIENIGRSYDVIGLVTVKMRKLAEFNHEAATSELIQKARQIGADAIVGFRYEISNTGSITDVITYGTAVKFK